MFVRDHDRTRSGHDCIESIWVGSPFSLFSFVVFFLPWFLPLDMHRLIFSCYNLTASRFSTTILLFCQPIFLNNGWVISNVRMLIRWSHLGTKQRCPMKDRNLFWTSWLKNWWGHLTLFDLFVPALINKKGTTHPANRCHSSFTARQVEPEMERDFACFSSIIQRVELVALPHTTLLQSDIIAI